MQNFCQFGPLVQNLWPQFCNFKNLFSDPNFLTSGLEFYKVRFLMVWQLVWTHFALNKGTVVQQCIPNRLKHFTEFFFKTFEASKTFKTFEASFEALKHFILQRHENGKFTYQKNHTQPPNQKEGEALKLP